MPRMWEGLSSSEWSKVPHAHSTSLLAFHKSKFTYTLFFLFFLRNRLLSSPQIFRSFSLKKMGDMNNAKEFTNEERSLLKFQKKQQHGQVLLLVVLLVYSYS